jgi:hypothetical protein
MGEGEKEHNLISLDTTEKNTTKTEERSEKECEKAKHENPQEITEQKASQDCFCC